MRGRVTETSATKPIRLVAFHSLYVRVLMNSVFRSSTLAEWGSAILVVIASVIVGRYAAMGMSPTQWACGAFAILGSVSVAVMVRVWPEPARATQEGRD